MKASTVLEALKKAIEEHGDAEIHFSDSSWTTANEGELEVDRDGVFTFYV